jgi:selenocysteine lyase/cysteine desulfurase
VAAARARFPALAGVAAYLDGPGGSQVPREVLDAIDACLRESNANLGGGFATSAAADEVMARGRVYTANLPG